ncbi:uncharacterized protein DNG_10363 [Cephalotrichum gorgonifer]|uniref:F-box domain-containing protein n=1 Tax=Cephalotrichum gorgonifer TaxID=2041049 RepID=A0AAE8N8U7_9PEZI|nr:uncharacterized protein DNG_10363 [Cephalotrichum gorgonifer]
MASDATVRRDIENLPDEILLAILAYLDEKTITALQLVSERFRTICRDDRLWQTRCFDQSRFFSNFLNWQALIQSQINHLNATHNLPATPATPADETTAAAVQTATTSSTPASRAHDRAQLLSQKLKNIRAISRKHLRANWDPSYPGERISWYDEYIHRYGPVTTNWFESPHEDGTATGLLNEVRGLALLNPCRAQRESSVGPLFAVSPLEDGTVCLFDVNGTRSRRGAILGSSRPGMLLDSGNESAKTSRSRRINSGVTECVSVDNQSNRAFFTAKSQLIEVDLERLDVISRQTFEWSITTLSEASPGVPLTVGTALGLHLHDHRVKRSHSPTHDEKIDLFAQIFSDDPIPPYAPLSQPTPLCIHHLPEAGLQDTISNDIYVAGRFPSILWYDRRKWPHILGSIHSGARLVSLTSLPYPFLNDAHQRRLGGLTPESILESKMAKGQTLIAAGEYETKGSLELTGLRSGQGKILGERSWDVTAGCRAQRPQKPWGYDKQSSQLNRQTASSAKIFSAIPHGTRIVFSDGCGDVKWFERDGITELRRHRIGSAEKHDPAYPSMFHQSANTGDFARKLLSTQTRHAGHSEGINTDDIVFWTGERLGMITFTSGKGFETKDFEDGAVSQRDVELEEKAEEYSMRMRRALEVHADEMRLTRNLVLGQP